MMDRWLFWTILPLCLVCVLVCLWGLLCGLAEEYLED